MTAVSLQRTFERAVAEHRAGRTLEATRLYGDVLRGDPQHEQALFLVSAISIETGRLDEARTILERLVQRCPQNAVYWSNLGETLRRQQHYEHAAAALARAVGLKPDLAQAHLNLALVAEQLGDQGLALQALERATELKPDDAQAQRRLASALVRERSFLRALGHFQCALALVPGSAPLWLEYAACLRGARRVDSALRAALRAVELDGKQPLAHCEVAAALLDVGRFDDAIASAERALALDSSCAAALTDLAGALVDSGRLAEGIAAYRKAAQLARDNHAAHGNVVFLSAFLPGVSAEQILAEARAFAQQHADELTAAAQPHPNDRTPTRRLRIGYVSSNFNSHCQQLFTLPLFEHHDRSAFELFAYANLAHEDDVTAKLRAHVEHWHDISRLESDAAAELVRSHEIDVLVDLTMHMSVSQLRLFAHKPAPVQIAWLAYPGTTGLAAMDYRVTDPHLDPPDAGQGPYSEQPLVLPDSFWCYAPGDDVPDVSPLPAAASGHVTFGCLNSFWKLNDATLELWARVLGRVQGSRLKLLAPEGSARSRLLGVLERAGVAAERVELLARRPRAQYLALYAGIDVCLDALPYNGHTTSLDAIYMGVPVITLVGDTIVGRAGLCQARNLDLPELIAETPDAFVDAAVSLAQDQNRLAALRAELRGRMRRSALMDAPRFARNLETLYRQAFERWATNQRS